MGKQKRGLRVDRKLDLDLVLEFFGDNVIPEPMSGCWLWTGKTYGQGYGRLFVEGVEWGAHRAAWTLANHRQIRRGYHILHSCDLPCCVNPEHLRQGTHQQNMIDKVKKGRWSNGKASPAL